MSFPRPALPSLLLSLACLALAGCGESGNPKPFQVPALQSLTVTPSSATLTVGDTRPLAVSGSYADGSTENLTSRVTYSSSAAAVVTVSAAGVVTAVAAGTATVTATDAGSGRTASAAITVQGKVPVSIAVTPRAFTVNVDGTQALAVTATYPDATTGTLTSGVTFSSSDTGIAAVSGTGVVTGKAAGTATVTATHTASGRTAVATATVEAVVLSYAVLDFRTAGVTYTLTPFGGESAELASSGVPAGGPSGQVARITRNAGSECWAGTTMSVGARLSIGRLPFSATAKTITVLMHVPVAGMSVKLKVENADDAASSVETDAVATTAGWQTLSFDFSRQSAGTAALDPARTYNKISIFPNFSCPGAGPTANEVFHVGTVSFIGAAAPSAPPLSDTPTGSSYTVMDFNTAGVTYTLTPFGGNGSELTSSGVPADGPAGQVVKIFRPVTAECYAGTTISTGANLSIPTLPFSATAKTMTVRFHSATAGRKIKLKVENTADGAQSVETDVNSVVGWQTLTFDFGSPSAGTAALDPAKTYNKLSLFADFTCGASAATADGTYFVGPISFIGASGPR